jgi:hypothetical protein
MATAEIVRSLVTEIILTPDDGESRIDVLGDLARILGLSLKGEPPAGAAGRVPVLSLQPAIRKIRAEWEFIPPLALAPRRAVPHCPPLTRREPRKVAREDSGHQV